MAEPRKRGEWPRGWWLNPSVSVICMSKTPQWCSIAVGELHWCSGEPGDAFCVRHAPEEAGEVPRG